MVDGLEQLQIWWCRLWRRRWLCLGVSWAACTPGWVAVGLLSADRPTVVAGFLLALVLLVGAAAGVVVATLVGGRGWVFDSVAELRRVLRRPVLGAVADLTPGPRRRATAHMAFALAGFSLIAAFAGLFFLRASGVPVVR